MDIIKQLENLNCGKVLANCNLKEYTTYQMEGIIDAVIFPTSIEELKTLLQFLKVNHVKHKIIGNGSNLIFEKHYNGVLIKLEAFHHLEINDTMITVGAGYSIMKLALKASRMGLSGLEFATGIPGTVGGAIFMNAGAYKSDMGYIVRTVTVLTPELEIKELTNQEMEFHYRTSFLQKHSGYICLEAKIELIHGDQEEISELIKERKKRRLETQPLEYPSAGSVFRNPEGDFAGRLIELIGYKGKKIGGAEVSKKHANFIINKDGATGEDIKQLIREIQEKVKKETGIELKVEQEFVE
ncbi:MAG: UDP-N-acetylmuramate dehydrogenase [Bacilli bacterium]|jgi:UDP-N-acetylmuramate dehydrogenase|nr:UDP-N-acetylmuramate dehydrogenase [Bacilli bacterium]